MKKDGFELKKLLERISKELDQLRQESQTTHETEYMLRKPVCEQREITTEQNITEDIPKA